MPRSRRRIVLAAAAFATLVACGDSSGPPPAHVGTYTLRTVHDKPLPVMLNGSGLQVFAGAITLREDGTYTRTWSTQFFVAGPGAQPIPNAQVNCRGTYSVATGFVTMTETTVTDECRSYTAGYRPDTLMHVHGDTLFGVYVK